MCGPSLSLNQSSAHPQSSEPQGGHAFEEGDSSRRVEVAPWVGSDDLDSLRGSGGGSVRHELENAHCLLFFSLSHSPLKGTRWHRTGQQPGCVYIYKNKIKKRGASVILIAPNWPNQLWFPGPDRAAGGIALADPRQEGSAISEERLGVAPEPGVVEPSCVVASGISEELSALQSRVLDMLSEAQTPSTRHLYALKWGVFVK